MKGFNCLFLFSTITSFIILFLFLGSSIAASNYEVIKLGDYRADANNVNNAGTFQIDNDGNIATTIETSPYLNQATLFKDNSQITISSPTGGRSYGYGLNGNGDVVGHYYDQVNDTENPYLYKDGVVYDIPKFIPSKSGYAKDINNLGEVVGHSNYRDGIDVSVKGFLYKDGTLTDLGTLGGSQSFASAINDKSQITGYSDIIVGVMHYDRAYIYENGVMRDLGTLPNGTESFGSDINELGEVAGTARVGTSYRAFFYKDAEGMIDLGNLTGNIVHDSRAYGLNNLGQVVGTSDNASNDGTAFLFDSGTMYDLNNLITSNNGCSITYAHDINDKGQIVGTGNCTTGLTVLLLNPLDDDDGDGVPNISDLCPDDPDKVEPGTAGCGVAEASVLPPSSPAYVPVFNGWWVGLGLLAGAGILRRRRS